MKFSDQPIARPGEDLLGRKDFALALARSIDQLSAAKDGFVIALVGEWGAGKTSIIRLVSRYLRHIEMARASERSLDWESTAEPRSLDEIEDMARIFERVEGHLADLDRSNKDIARSNKDGRWHELRKCLASNDETDIADRYWRLKNHIETNPHTTVVVFSPWLIAGRVELASALISDLARALGRSLGNEIKQAFGDLLKRISEFIPLVGAGLDVSTGIVGTGSFIRAGGDWSKSIANRMTSGPTLEEARNNLRRILGELKNQQVLVIIDDLDRLEPREALEMVSLVKSVGDLPNVIYLLGYDDLKLAALINRAVGVDGGEFLEKIVQYPVHVPPIDSDDLVQLFSAEILTQLDDLPEDEGRRLGNAWHYILRFYLRTPRDVRRFINSYGTSHSGLAEYTDPIDLLVLECLRLFEPEIYHFLRRNLLDLTG